MAETTLPGAMAQPFSNPLTEYKENFKAGKEAEQKVLEETSMLKQKEMEPLIAQEREKRQEFAGRQKEISTELTKPFQVPQATMADYASMGGMLAIIGTMFGGAGKQPAAQALAAMTGTLDGYQKGRKDLVDRSFKEFEANMKRLQALMKAVDVELAAYGEDAKLGRESASVRLEVASALVRRGSLEGLIRGQSADSILKAREHAQTLGQNAAQHADRIAMDKKRLDGEEARRAADAAAAKQKEEMTPVYKSNGVTLNVFGRPIPNIPTDATRFGATSGQIQRFVNEKGEIIEPDANGKFPPGQKVFKMGPPPKEGGGGAGAAAGQIERISGAISQVRGAIENVADLPITTTSPLFGQKLLSNSLFLAPLSVLNQTMDDTTTQMMATRMVAVARGLATLETGGAATGLVGLADSIEKGVTIPKGAQLYVALDKLAEMRRIVDDAALTALASNKYTPEQKELIRYNRDRVHESIPFTQKEVTAAVKAGLDQKLNAEQKRLTFTEFAKVKFPQSSAAPAGGGNAPPSNPPAAYPNAKKGNDGGWYIPDPSRQGKYLKVG
jgi:hypothetical protein